MKILWLSHLVPYPPKGGVLQRSYHLLKQVSMHHDVDLMAFNQKDLIRPLFKDVEDGVSEAHQHLSRYCRHIEFFDIPSDRFPFTKKILALKSLFTRFPYTLNWLLSGKFKQCLEELISNNNYDFIHFDTISLAPFKPACGSIPTSLDHHNIESHMLLRRASKENNFLKKIYFLQEGKRLEKYEKIFCPQFTFNFTCSDLDTARLKSNSPASDIYTIPNGVDTMYFNPEPGIDKKNRLLFIGTLSWYPNIEAIEFIAKEIWPLIKEEFPDIEFDLIGANPPESMKEVGLCDKNFHVHGFVDDIIPYFKKAKCYVCPIKDGGGTKLKILDALSMGMAIVADPIACEGINVEDKNNILFAESAEEYVISIKKVLTQNELRENLQRNARLLATDKYSYGEIGKKLSSLFTQYQKSN